MGINFSKVKNENCFSSSFDRLKDDYFILLYLKYEFLLYFITWERFHRYFPPPKKNCYRLQIPIITLYFEILILSHQKTELKKRIVMTFLNFQRKDEENPFSVWYSFVSFLTFQQESFLK